MAHLNTFPRDVACWLVAAVISVAGGTIAQADPDEQAMAVTGKTPSGFALTYNVYSGGFRAMRLDFTVALDGDGAGQPRYDTRINMETSGLVGALFNWRFDASSVGEWQDEAVPTRYRTANVWRGNAREVAIDYEDGVASAVSAEPPYSAEDLEKVAPFVTPGAVDPTTAVTSLVMKSALEDACHPPTAHHDGRRRSAANMPALPPRPLTRRSTAPFEGQLARVQQALNAEVAAHREKPIRFIQCLAGGRKSASGVQAVQFLHTGAANYCASRYFSASSAAIQPNPADVTACR